LAFVQQLEDAYKELAEVEVGIHIADGITLDDSKISIVGAAFNAGEDAPTVTLNFSVPSEEDTDALDYNPLLYKNALALDLGLTGTADEHTLAVPVRITMPIPEGFSPSRIYILHYLADGGTTEIRPKINGDGTMSFTLTSFSTFLFVEDAVTVPPPPPIVPYVPPTSATTTEPEPEETSEPEPSAPPVAEAIPLQIEKVNTYTEETFADVDPSDWFAESVQFVYEYGLFNGTDETAFSPSAKMSRSMLITALARAAGVDTDGGENWYELAVEWAKENGISDGTSLNGEITREQLVTMLWRFAGSPSTDGAANFGDAGDISGYASDAIAWAVENGFVTGKPGNVFDPRGSATRAEVAAILQRFMEKAQ
jgi:hypothetical protein